MLKNIKNRLGWILGIGSILFLQAYSSASASCVFNHTDKTLNTYLSCGWVCENTWTIKPGEHKCRGGTGGLVGVYGGVPKYGTQKDLELINVDNHGYVAITKGFKGKSEYDTVCSYRQDHSVKRCDPLLAPNGGF